ncbi:MAG: hypothetical protein PHP44_01030 [Kiritimatiellae bacterium]|nr:hypothetical protein [Kiritimatiellia bacterium]
MRKCCKEVALQYVRSAADLRVDLDKTIRAMVEARRDMNPKYRETAAGGLATLVGLGEDP